MKVLNDIIEKCEKIYKKRNDYHSVVPLVSRLYLSFLETGVFGYADNAFFISIQKFKNNTLNIIYLLIAGFFEMETDRNTSAIKRISVCSSYKGYLKANLPEIYAFYLYINSTIMFKEKNIRASLKDYREIVSIYEQTENHLALLFLARLDIEYDNFGSAKKRLEAYLETGEKSHIFYVCLYKYFSSKNKSIYCTSKLFIPFLKWGMSHGLNLQNVVSLYSHKVCEVFRINNNIGFKLYDLYENEDLLKEICMHYINNNDLSENAFKYYNLAVKKQVILPGLNAYFIRSSFYNKNEKLGIFPIKTFLSCDSIGDDIKPYIYSIILSNDKFYDVLKERFYEIVDFGIQSVEKGYSGKYYDRVYKFIIENKNKFDDTDDVIKKMEEMLFPFLFVKKIKISNGLAKKCIVLEKNKKTFKVLDLVNGECEINSSSDFLEVSFANSENQFIDSEYTVEKNISNIKFSLCKTFLEDGYISDELDIALANYYIDMEYPSNKCIDIFERVLKLDISDDFRSKIIFTLGNLYYYQLEIDKSLFCFEHVDAKHIKDKYIKNIFDVFIEKEKYFEAAKLISEKSYCIPDKALFVGIRKLSKIEELKPLIVECAYELVLRSRYDRHIIKLLLDYYKGGRRDWILICDVLYNMGTPNKSIDEKIMKISMQTRVFDERVQVIFDVMYQNYKNNELIKEFAEYCCYEMIVNSVRPLDSTINILEKLFFTDNNELISYALMHTYLIHNIKTQSRDAILYVAYEYMKKRNIIFPIFKELAEEYKDDIYIEKNQPFIYYAPSDRSVIFYFREKGEFDFYSKTMYYLDFGIYYINIPMFYGEEIEYYICENKEKGSIETPKQVISNKSGTIHENVDDDPFVEINNSIIYQSIYRYEEAENIISKKIRKNNTTRCSLL